jgi:PTH1 family peptidyl-tRNA hydrolase
MTWVLVGLGNPGAQYALNRHNIGFMAVDVIADQHKASAFKIKTNTALAEVTLHGERVFLCKPQTFMNVSGRGVAPLLSFYKIPLDRVIVFHDELDLEPGRIKIKQGGSSGGHNGLGSLDQAIGKDYWRVRIGIGHPGHKDAVSGYVLSNFRKEEYDGWILDRLARLSDTLPSFLESSNPVQWLNTITS